MSILDIDRSVHLFILEAIDPNFGCSVLEAELHITDLAQLRTLLGVDALGDVELRGVYTIDAAELRAISGQYGVDFDPGERECRLSRAHAVRDAPYLVHTGYELFLMLEGVKPFAMFTIEYPGMAEEFPEEVLFEPYVLSGKIIKRVMADIPFEEPIRGPSGPVFEGVRQVLYSLPGEEWRCDAQLLLSRQLAHGPWNDTLERLEGSLLGYTDEQNDWWIAHRRTLRSVDACHRGRG